METPIATPSVVAASPGRRLGAGLIDVVLVIVAGVIFTLVFGSQQPKGSLNMTVNDIVVNDWGVVTFVVLALAYFFVAEASTGTTIGKALTGLRVTMVDGRPATPEAIFTRTMLRPLDGLPYVIPNLLGFVVLASSKKHQRLGDMVAGTIVTSTPRPPTPQPMAEQQ
jgi:uncharacterized RDD family membrane protein YckC